MTENKKIRNATAKECNGIKFKSILETATYRILVENELNPEYEAHTYIIVDRFIPKVPFYTKNKFTRKNHNIDVISNNVVRDRRPQSTITYTPDFVLTYKNKTIIIECKGFQNDVYPYKMKLFRKYLNECVEKSNSCNYEIWEVYSKRQLIELINILKDEN